MPRSPGDHRGEKAGDREHEQHGGRVDRAVATEGEGDRQDRPELPHRTDGQDPASEWTRGLPGIAQNRQDRPQRRGRQGKPNHQPGVGAGQSHPDRHAEDE
jgi:hypothetical protein